MKKILCLILTAILVLTPAAIVSAKQDGHHDQKTEQQRERIKEKKQSFKINGSPVIKYGKYKLPISPVTKGMGATVTFDKATGVLTVTKGTVKIVIDLKNMTATVNGVADTKSGIFTAKNNKKMTVLIGYIARALGCRVSTGKDDIIVTIPGLDFPSNVTVTPTGATVVVNTLNSTTAFITASAKIIAGQATGGKAELYVGSKLVATDSTITATDTVVTFTTADETPTNAELQAAIPFGGVVTVKLYNLSNNCVTSVTANPTLTVDYAAPTITGITSAVYSVSGSAITIAVTGGSAVGDKVDVTKLSLFDTALGRAYQLTGTAGTGSTGIVSSENTLLVTLGLADQLGLTGFGTSTMFLSVGAGSLLSDTAGNTSLSSSSALSVPVTVISNQ